jgi:hypothetical protein
VRDGTMGASTDPVNTPRPALQLALPQPDIARKIQILAGVASLILWSLMVPSKNCGSSLSKGR